MNKLYILALEPLMTRYTSQWLDQLPSLIEKYISSKKLNYEVVNILGDTVSEAPTEGAFLNFIETNIWKATQLIKLCRLFQNNTIQNGDKILITDAWNPALLQIKYMIDLLELDVEIHSIFHAGSYDPHDLLGEKIKDKLWSYNAEKSFFYASNKNYFATYFHLDLFTKVALKKKSGHKKGFRVGLPFDYLKHELKYFDVSKKEDIILFPHRLSKEKQLNIFKDLEKELPQYKFIVCQEKSLSKKEYYSLIAKSKIIFSANLQETLGISCYEGMLLGTFPLVPDRLSYKEMYAPQYKYPSKWTETFASYNLYKANLKLSIEIVMKKYSEIDDFPQQVKLDGKDLEKYFTFKEMGDEIFNL